MEPACHVLVHALGLNCLLQLCRSLAELDIENQTVRHRHIAATWYLAKLLHDSFPDKAIVVVLVLPRRRAEGAQGFFGDAGRFEDASGTLPKKPFGMLLRRLGL